MFYGYKIAMFCVLFAYAANVGVCLCFYHFSLSCGVDFRPHVHSKVYGIATASKVCFSSVIALRNYVRTPNRKRESIDIAIIMQGILRA